MISILLFLISSTLRAKDAQKPKPKNYCAHAQIFLWRAAISNSAQTYNIFFSRIFWLIQNMENV